MGVGGQRREEDWGGERVAASRRLSAQQSVTVVCS